MNDEGVLRLRASILKQAVDDLKELMSGKITEDKWCNYEELQSFFNDTWFDILCVTPYIKFNIEKKVQAWEKKSCLKTK